MSRIRAISADQLRKKLTSGYISSIRKPVQSPVSAVQKPNLDLESRRSSLSPFFRGRRNPVVLDSSSSMQNPPLPSPDSPGKLSKSRHFQLSETGRNRLFSEPQKISSSFELMKQLEKFDVSLRNKVDAAFISTWKLNGEAIKAMIAERENQPKRMEIVRKSEGLDYEIEEKRPMDKRPPRSRSQPRIRPTFLPAWKSSNPTLNLHSTIRRNPTFSSFKSRKAIQQDIQRVQDLSFHILKATETMSRDMSRSFLKAPVVRPRSRAARQLQQI